MENIFLPYRLIRPILHFHDKRPRLQGPYGVPLSNWNVQRYDRPVRRKLYSVCTSALKFIIELFHQPATQAHHRFGAVAMPMDGQRATGRHRFPADASGQVSEDATPYFSNSKIFSIRRHFLWLGNEGSAP